MRKKATIQDVSNLAGVSVGTVSRFINGYSVKDGNKKAIQSAIDALDYNVNTLAKGLKLNRTFTIGLLFPSLNDIFVTEVMDGVESVLETVEYSSIVAGSNNSLEVERRKIEVFNAKRVDGVIMMPVSDQSAENIKLLSEDIPLVLIDRRVPNLSINYVTCKNEQGAYEGVIELINNGHDSIGLILGPDDVYTARERKKGYLRALEEFGIPVREELIETGKYQKDGGLENIQQLMQLDKRPTAVFASNFEMTMSAIKYFMKNGITIGDDISLLGYDNIDVFQMLSPTIFTIEQPMEEIGIESAHMILNKIKNPDLVNKNVVLPTRLVPGNSIKKIK
ncbi:LacI family transcriptional regulator [Erysipelothrix sp. HDW6C]|uniref:LacI family DNA-binding transcriptional regulator n=1 Tax=Erysipelothrix sp. HDW6C TaxID=2714930 RepID=UPI001407AEF2|nr:LacI family DNA-binding transcriptional regulator [Erysipelothrix sp. HDW6C]QIK70672.1 LacI family transcriptional regulator [Erysipelothrix sp. HDW6C]